MAKKSKKNKKARRPKDLWIQQESFGPTTDDALAVMKLYELRREEVMRRSRNVVIAWKPQSAEEALAIASWEHADNEAFRQVSSYFELAFGLARRGAVNAELIAEWCGEGIFLFSKVEPYLGALRQEVSPTAFRNAEWVCENTEWGKQRLAYFRSR